MFSKVISYFNYINRVADALGLEPRAGNAGGMRTLAEEERAIKVMNGRLPRQSAIVPFSELLDLLLILKDLLGLFVDSLAF